MEQSLQMLEQIYDICEKNNQLLFIIAVLLFLILFTDIVKSILHI